MVQEIRTETNHDSIAKKMQALGEIIADSVQILDPLPRPLRLDQPPPPVRDVDMTRFAPIAQAVRDVLTLPNAQKDVYPLLRDGLTPAMLTASNPKLLEELYQLSIEVIDTYGKGWNSTVYARDAAKSHAEYLTARPVYDMSGYVKRYQERYPK